MKISLTKKSQRLSFKDIDFYGYLLRYMPFFRFSDFTDSTCAYALKIFF